MISSIGFKSSKGNNELNLYFSVNNLDLELDINGDLTTSLNPDDVKILVDILQKHYLDTEAIRGYLK